MPKDMSLNRQSKNSVFVNFFKDKKNILRMYQELHPDAKDITVDDITVDTLESMIVNTLYSDLGFRVKDKYIFLAEAQSDWNENIAIRLLFYLIETLRRYINESKQSELDSKRIHLPTPELYVIYSGPGKKPDVISLSEDFFGGNPDFELKVHVISKVDETLPGQYIGFCKIFDEQRKLYEDGMTIAKETYRLCIENNYLSDFMKSHEQEVIDMMYELFDEETARKQLDAARSKRDIETGRAEGKAEEKISVALRLLSFGTMPQEDIAKATDLPLEKIKELATGTSS